MKIDGNAVRPGNVIEHEGSLWRAVKIQHTQPGKGGAYLQVELKNLFDGTKKNERFRSSEKVERVRLDTKDFQYLFGDDDSITFMDMESFEQIALPRENVGEQAVFLQDGMAVMIEFFEDRPISVQLPEHVTLEVAETEPVVKGQTAASSYKPAKLDNGVRVMVPPFIGVGDRIVVATADASYVRRAD
ncbi:MAG: elongation factor P [Alphaproteobacteria bacterium]|nr:MAG: elongation factor P [Alphaproteobacteria bacterium]